MFDKWGWEMWFSRFHIGIRDGVHNPTSMFPVGTRMPDGFDNDIQHHVENSHVLTHMDFVVAVARIGGALVVAILFGHSLVLFFYLFFSYQLSTLRALL